MNILSPHQSAILKQLSLGKASYTSFTEEEKEICHFLARQGYITLEHEWVTIPESDDIRVETKSAAITEEGKMYLINEQLSVEQRQHLQEQLNSLKEMADSARRQAEIAARTAKSAETEAQAAVRSADLAESDAESSRRDARFSKIVSIISASVSIATAILSVIL